MNPSTVLDALGTLPLYTWQYRTQPDSVRHIGPTAQDFHAAFGLGEDARRIATVDADGIALAAIQGLLARTREQAAQIEQLTAALEAQQTALQALDERLQTLEGQAN